jgi:hypothetical protein
MNTAVAWRSMGWGPSVAKNSDVSVCGCPRCVCNDGAEPCAQGIVAYSFLFCLRSTGSTLPYASTATTDK